VPAPALSLIVAVPPTPRCSDAGGVVGVGSVAAGLDVASAPGVAGAVGKVLTASFTALTVAVLTTTEMTAYLGGASPVLQVRDSRLRWDGGTDSNGQCRWVKLR